MFHFAGKGGYYLSAAFIQERPLIKHIRYMVIRPVPNTQYSNFFTYYSNYLFTLDQPNIQLHQPIIQIDDTYYSTYTAAK